MLSKRKSKRPSAKSKLHVLLLVRAIAAIAADLDKKTFAVHLVPVLLRSQILPGAATTPPPFSMRQHVSLIFAPSPARPSRHSSSSYHASDRARVSGSQHDTEGKWLIGI